jgi:hypothetical protein
MYHPLLGFIRLPRQRKRAVPSLKRTLRVSYQTSASISSMGWFQGNSSGNYFLLVEAANLEKKCGIINRDGALIFLNDQLN